MTTKAPPEPTGGAFLSAQNVLTRDDAAIINRRDRQHPGGKPSARPRFRILMSKSMWKAWVNAIGQAGDQNVQQLWDHLAYRPDQPALLGSVTRLKGGQARGKDGWSDVHHYEITGAGRIDYQFHPRYAGGTHGDPHAVVKIIRIDMSSH